MKAQNKKCNHSFLFFSSKKPSKIGKLFIKFFIKLVSTKLLTNTLFANSEICRFPVFYTGSLPKKRNKIEQRLHLKQRFPSHLSFSVCLLKLA